MKYRSRNELIATMLNADPLQGANSFLKIKYKSPTCNAYLKAYLNNYIIKKYKVNNAAAELAVKLIIQNAGTINLKEIEGQTTQVVNFDNLSQDIET
jgi:hypothetical protein